jgi:hypothetical protein
VLTLKIFELNPMDVSGSISHLQAQPTEDTNIAGYLVYGVIQRVAKMRDEMIRTENKA